ncbi:MAG: phenylacetate--CoA ligase family protein [Actinomycetota bacterium]|nr:phenylacetate--CoA ligase family protein [Actinomycetota bacterium]
MVESLGPIAAALDIHRARREGAAGIALRQQRRLAELVEFARERSPYYRRLYHGLPSGVSDPHLIPWVSKRALMANFDDWVTDPSITESGVRDFISDPRRVGRPYLGRYYPITTSGSTGEPALVIHDPYSWLMMALLARLRMAARFERKELLAIGERGVRVAALFATGGHYGGEVFAAKLVRDHPWLASRVRILSVLQPTDALVKGLNAFQPATLTGYPSALALMAGEQAAGRLRISPVLARTAGENLTDEMRSRITSGLGCRVIDSYASSEAPALGTECQYHWQHINTDWYLFEPVEADYSPTPPGKLSATVLVTNLANRVQPFIRYDQGDRILVKPDPCACGSPFPAVRVMGRSTNLLGFSGSGGGEVQVIPLALGSVVEHAAGLHRFQAIQTSPATMRLRVEAEPGADTQTVFLEARSLLAAYLEAQGAGDVRIEFDPEPPRRDPRSGKFHEVWSEATPPAPR